MNEDPSPSSFNRHVEAHWHGLKHGRLTGQKEAMKQARTRMLKVSDFRNHFLFINEVKVVSHWWSSMFGITW
ncbi:hypothetical protein HanIR_Chr05g0219331 [Helianthus annuus]|nr:hypothetical protein HanIR_Chr05g0219331 [Helianthus annuus]